MSIINVAKRAFSVSKQLTGIFNYSCIIQLNNHQKWNLDVPAARNISTTNGLNDVNKSLMEFFDAKKYWGENEVKHGRSWTKPELRLRSNPDLHKLWYVLLKERNMLLTMEHECTDKHTLFPSEERLEKVKDSMQHLEEVVRERNRAYYELETGTTGERPGQMINNELGMRYYYKQSEHSLPRFMNRKWQEKHKFNYGGYAVKKFLLKFRERIWNEKRKAINRDRNQVVHLLKRNPNLDRGMLSRKYPTVDIEKLIKYDKIRGHYEPKM